jgi:hypothetical protein
MELEAKLQRDRLQISSESSTQGTGTQHPVRGPKLPAFDDSKDNIDAYIQRFKIYATSQNWTRDRWGVHLSALLKGKALDVFARLSPEIALDFKELKQALLKRFDMTEDGFRKKFRSSKPDGSETFMQFSSRIDSYLERWIELSGTNKTYKDLIDLFLREQFILCCSKDLGLFLKERIPKTIQEMARFADQFAEARTTTPSLLAQKPAIDKKPVTDKQIQPNQTGSGIKCFNCG